MTWLQPSGPSFAALLLAAPLNAQTSATLQGRVFDESGALIPGATIAVRSESTGFSQVVSTDAEGRYAFTAMPPGGYEITAAATGFRTETIAQLTFEVGRTIVHDFRLEVGDTAEMVVVVADALLVDRASSIVGHVVTATTIQAIPLNGSHFTDLGLLVPGSVAPSQTGFATRPIRGLGALAINTAGNREEAVGFVINGVTSNNLTFGSLMFEPPLAASRNSKSTTLCSAPSTDTYQARSSTLSVARAPTSCTVISSASCGMMPSMPAISSSSRRLNHTVSSGASSGDRWVGQSFVGAASSWPRTTASDNVRGST